jgi:hypothetical protein
MMAKVNGRQVAQNIGNEALPLLMTELLDRTYASDDAKTVAETIGVIERFNNKDDLLRGAHVVVSVNIGDPDRQRSAIEVTDAAPRRPRVLKEVPTEEIVQVLSPPEEDVDLSMFELDLGALVNQQRG